VDDKKSIPTAPAQYANTPGILLEKRETPARQMIKKETAMTTRATIRNHTRRLAALAAAGLLATSLTGCNNGQEGALSGAALGALAGMGIGSLSGDMGKGAAAGAIIGGLGGLVLGDQNRRNAGY
jgi:osmotically inducible lipoprotein OsmB